MDTDSDMSNQEFEDDGRCKAKFSAATYKYFQQKKNAQ